MIRLAVFASGEGTNLEALALAIEAGTLQARIACVVCDRPGAGVLGRACKHGLRSFVADPSAHPGREAHERAVVRAIEAEGGVDLAVLAGYMRIAGPVLRSAPWPMINLHPSLLPSFPGRDAVAQALSAGVRVTGVTVHFVDAGVDTGPIIAQEAVRVHEGDDEARLAARIHRAEHRLLPQVVALVDEGRVRLENGRVRILAARRAARTADGHDTAARGSGRSRWQERS